MLFQIDNREHKLIQELQTRSLAAPFEIAQLPIGDVVIGSTTFERKTLADLQASVKDGRYREQKKRAVANGIALSYVIEGAFRFSDATDESKMLTGCVVNTLVRDRIPIVFCPGGLAETADFIECLVRRMAADPAKYTPSDPDSSTQSASYTSSICLKKKENVTPETCLVLQLACIPGISSKKAQDILAAHPGIQTMQDLVTHLAATTPAKFADTTPGIGKTLAATLYRFLLLAAAPAGTEATPCGEPLRENCKKSLEGH